MKKIMILGAGISQVPLIRKAKEMGLYVIVVSRQGNYPGFVLADQVYYVDTTNAERILEIALMEKIAGICTTGTDVAVRSIGKVVDAMGLSGAPYDAAAASSNKLNMKEAFSQYGVRTAQFIKVEDQLDALKAFRKLGSPVIFKAVDSGASKGIVRVDDEENIDYAYHVVKNATTMNFFLVEEYIEGIEFGAQAFVFDNQIQFILSHGDMMFYADTGVPIGHYVPYDMPKEIHEDVNVQLRKSIEALQINNCAINADFILKDDKVYVLEIGVRAGATCLPELVSTYYGFDYYEVMIHAALGRTPEISIITSQPCACELIISDKGGKIISLNNDNKVHEDIIQISFDYNVSDIIPRFKVGTDRIGQIVVKGESLEKALQLLNEIKNNINIEIRST